MVIPPQHNFPVTQAAGLYSDPGAHSSLLLPRSRLRSGVCAPHPPTLSPAAGSSAFVHAGHHLPVPLSHLTLACMPCALVQLPRSASPAEHGKLRRAHNPSPASCATTFCSQDAREQPCPDIVRAQVRYSAVCGRSAALAASLLTQRIRTSTRAHARIRTRTRAHMQALNQEKSSLLSPPEVTAAAVLLEHPNGIRLEFTKPIAASVQLRWCAWGILCCCHGLRGLGGARLRGGRVHMRLARRQRTRGFCANKSNAAAHNDAPGPVISCCASSTRTLRVQLSRSHQ